MARLGFPTTLRVRVAQGRVVQGGARRRDVTLSQTFVGGHLEKGRGEDNSEPSILLTRRAFENSREM